MATPLAYLLMANSTATQNNQEPTKQSHLQSSSSKQEQSNNNRSGRKPSKSQQPPRKKIPQRGMGVAQLERLRLQEKLKSIQENNKFESFNIQSSPSSVHHFHDDLSLLNPLQSFPVHYNVPSVVNGGSGVLGFDHQGVVVKRIESVSNFGSHHFSGPFVVNPFVFGVADDFKVKVGIEETSKELSSMPKLLQRFELSSTPPGSDLGFKKKRFNLGENNNNGRNDEKFAKITTPFNVSDFLNSNPENTIDLNNHPSGFGARAARSAFYANQHNFNEGAEVLAVRRKGNQSGGNVFMEYDFFPGKSKSNSGKKSMISTCFKEMEFLTTAEEEEEAAAAGSSVAVAEVVGSSGGYGGEASCLKNSDHYYYNYSASDASASSNSIDLSLKLSY